MLLVRSLVLGRRGGRSGRRGIGSGGHDRASQQHQSENRNSLAKHEYLQYVYA